MSPAPCDTTRRRLLAALPAAVAARAAPAQPRWPFPTLAGAPPLVIAHRGASGYRPEHTLAAYELAIAQGADFIEPDLVATGDGALIARHENELSLTTDVAHRPRFADRRRTQRIDGREVSGWFSEDFSLEEIRALRATERFAGERPRNAQFDGRFGLATLDEIIALVARAKRDGARTVGLYPELKHAAHFNARGVDVEARLADALHAAGWRDAHAPVFVQSFEPEALRRFAGLSDLPRIQLLGRMPSAGQLRALARDVQGIGVAKSLVFPRDAAGAIAEASSLVRDAHALGLLVHAWTFRAEDVFLPTNLRGRPQEELERFLAAGVDGVFTDFPDLAVAARRTLAGR